MCIVVGRSRKCKQCLQNSNNGEDSLHAVALASPGMKPRTVLLLLSSSNLEQAEALNKAFAKPFNNNNVSVFRN